MNTIATASILDKASAFDSLIIILLLVVAAGALFTLHLGTYISNRRELAYCISTGTTHVDTMARARNDVSSARRHSVLYGVIFGVVVILCAVWSVGLFI